jgi:hypothetical protein
MKDKAIRCNRENGPSFGYITISDRCNQHKENCAFEVGDVYINDSGMNFGNSFISLGRFQVKEIEVFEITDFDPDASPIESSLPPPTDPSLDSQIISDFPEIFAEFQRKQFSLLWRGSRDGLSSKEFHHRCDGYENTLTIILDTEGNICGGFTPVNWSAAPGMSSCAGERHDRSFIFTLKNPHNIPARRFALNKSKSTRTVRLDIDCGPVFGMDDLGFRNDSGGGAEGFTSFGEVYINDTDLDGETLLTGSKNFKIKEIEVFWISDFSPLTVEPSRQPGDLDSRIIPDVPEIFAEFRGKQISLLWRGSRDGFTAEEFHRRCDDHGNTLTVILTIKEDIFGGFTPVKWASEVPRTRYQQEDENWKGDDSLKSFLFTLKNSSNVPPRRFALNPNKKSKAIRCDPRTGPSFGELWELEIANNCHANRRNRCGGFGSAYINDTGCGGSPIWNRFLAGSWKFRVREIEVFEITD